MPPETAFEVVDAPENLGTLIAGSRERQDGVVISLGDSTAVAAIEPQAFAIAVEDALIGFRGAVFHPRQQCGAKVEADPSVIVDDLANAPVRIENARGAIREIALPGDALVPVVIRGGGILGLNCFQPGIFARGLVKMTMNAGETFHLS